MEDNQSVEVLNKDEFDLNNVNNKESIEEKERLFFKKYTLSDIGIFICTIFLTFCYIGTFIYGIFQKIDPTNVVSVAQAQLIINSSIFGILCAWVPYFLKYILRIKIGFSINLGIQIIATSGLILGEVFQFYYLIPGWDSILHFSTGAGFCFLGYALFMLFVNKSNLKHKVLLGIMFGIFCSLGIALLWEIYEFTCDTLGGLNMQKVLPEDVPWFNGGDTFADIVASDEVIADFYRSPEGYKYALKDTMSDILYCFAGTGSFAVIASIISYFKPHSFDNLIQIVPSRKAK